MKIFIALIGALFISASFAETAPVYFDKAGMQYSMDPSGNLVDTSGNLFVLDEAGNIISLEEIQEAEVQAQNKTTTQNSAKKTTSERYTTSRNASRAMPSVSTTVAKRTTAVRPTSNRTTTTRNAISSRTSNRATTSNVTSRKSPTNTNIARSADINTARSATATYNEPSSSSARVSIRSSGVTMRAPTSRTISTEMTTIDNSYDITSADQLAQMTDFCKAQYTECMDQYCNVLDENQGRCSCSENIDNYSKTEDALKEATIELQNVAQKIQYIGLKADEIDSLFTQTEAEEAMQGQTDTTQLKNDLESIKDLIIDVKSGSANSSGSNIDLSSLLDFNFSNSGFDLSSFLGTGSVSSISNQRGEKLYATATARCKTSVLDDCIAKGVDEAIITNSYDLEIDKQCLSYEKELVEANDEMKTTVRNAKTVLQKARLLVAQSKNSYDLKGCITALDECMQDDFVCGDDYEECLDPTGKYIVSGEVVAGSEPGVSGGDISPTSGSADIPTGLYTVWNYSTNNTWGDGSIDGFISEFIAEEDPSGENMIGYLQQKIGYHDNDDGRDYGLCVSVLNKCQDISYDDNDDYQRDNKVIEGYIQRTITQIKAAQDEVLADYAEDCISDVTTCLANNEYDEDNSLSMSAAKKACSAVIRTCASVTGNSENSVVASAVSSTTYSDQYSITYELNGLGSWETSYTPVSYYDINFTYTLPSLTDTAVIIITDTTCLSDYSWYDAATAGTVVSNIPANPTSSGGSKKFYLRCND